MDGQIVVIVVVFAMAAAVFLWARGRVAKGGEVVLPTRQDLPIAAPVGPLAGLAVGAVVVHDGRELAVRGEVRFKEEDSVWTEYHLDTGTGTKTWLSFDPSHASEVTIWEAAAAGDLHPGRRSVTHDGRTYKKVDWGKAAFTTAGTTELPAVGTAWYADYAAEGGRLLGFGRWSKDGSWEVSTGVQIPARDVQVQRAGAAAD